MVLESFDESQQRQNAAEESFDLSQSSQSGEKQTKRGTIGRQATFDLPAKFQRRNTIFRRQWTSDATSEDLKAVIKKESTNLNYKFGLNIVMIIALILVQVLRGSGSEPSVIGATRCTPIDWVLFASLLIFALAMTILAIFMQRREYEYKKKISYNFVPGDFKCTTWNAFKLPIYGFMVGMICAATGVGSGAFYNTLLVQLDLHPQVATATGQYLGTITGLAATICMFIYG